MAIVQNTDRALGDVWNYLKLSFAAGVGGVGSGVASSLAAAASGASGGIDVGNQSAVGAITGVGVSAGLFIFSTRTSAELGQYAAASVGALWPALAWAVPAVGASVAGTSSAEEARRRTLRATA